MIRLRGRRGFLGLLLAAPLAGLAEGRVIELEIAGRKPRGGVRTERIVRGERVQLRIRADEATTLHVHGLEYELAVKAGVEATLDIEGRSTGRFPVTAHLHDPRSGKKAPEPTLLYLEVHPR